MEAHEKRFFFLGDKYNYSKDKSFLRDWIISAKQSDDLKDKKPMYCLNSKLKYLFSCVQSKMIINSTLQTQRKQNLISTLL